MSFNVPYTKLLKPPQPPIMMPRPSSRRLLHRKKYPNADQTPRNILETSHRFDDMTGQIYTETTILIQSGDDSNWARELRFGITGRSRKFSLPTKKLKRRESTKDLANERSIPLEASKGARSLHDIAIETTINNLDGTSFGVLECVPIPILERIWDAIIRKHLISLEIWKIFYKLVHQGKTRYPNLLRYSDMISYPRSPLETYLQPLTSHSFDFITCLSITAHFSVPDLVKISKVRNLGILDITSTPSSPFLCTDSIIRAWSIAACEENAFSVLRILRLLNHEDVTNKSLLYLNTFPALGVYEVANCGFDRSANADARNLGWKLTADAVLPQLEAARSERLESLRASFGFEEAPRLLSSAKRNLNITKDENSCRLFDIIGELRSDSDLKGAGMAVGIPVFTDEGGLSSVPIAALNLGPAEPVRPRRSLSFLRIKLPLRLQDQHESLVDQTKNILKQKESAESSRSIAGKKAMSALPKSKKRKLEDILNSFT